MNSLLRTFLHTQIDYRMSCLSCCYELFSALPSLSLSSDALSSTMLSMVNPPWDGFCLCPPLPLPFPLPRSPSLCWLWSLGAYDLPKPWAAAPGWRCSRAAGPGRWCGTGAGRPGTSPSPESCRARSGRPTRSLFQYRMFWLGTSCLCVKMMEVRFCQTCQTALRQNCSTHLSPHGVTVFESESSNRSVMGALGLMFFPFTKTN